MQLCQKVEKILKNLDEEKAKNKANAIRRAEELSDKYQDVKPKNEIASTEKYMGLSTFPNRNST